MPLIGRDNVDRAIAELVERKNQQVRAIFFQGLQNIQLGTPVAASAPGIVGGRTRNNWYFSVGMPSSNSTTAISGNSLSLSELPIDVLGKTMYFTNNSPNIESLEYGYYPDPVINGTRINRSGTRENPITPIYEKRSIGGFSRQAVGGWVRTEIHSVRNAIRSV